MRKKRKHREKGEERGWRDRESEEHEKKKILERVLKEKKVESGGARERERERRRVERRRRQREREEQ